MLFSKILFIIIFFPKKVNFFFLLTSHFNLLQLNMFNHTNKVYFQQQTTGRAAKSNQRSKIGHFLLNSQFLLYFYYQTLSKVYLIYKTDLMLYYIGCHSIARLDSISHCPKYFGQFLLLILLYNNHNYF